MYLNIYNTAEYLTIYPSLEAVKVFKEGKNLIYSTIVQADVTVSFLSLFDWTPFGVSVENVNILTMILTVSKIFIATQYSLLS